MLDKNLEELFRKYRDQLAARAKANSPTENTQKEFDFLEGKRHEAEIQDYTQDVLMRKKYAAHIFWLMCGWLLAILAIIFLEGFKYKCFDLSDTILITLITTTTGNIALYFLVVTKYLFPAKK